MKIIDYSQLFRDGLEVLSTGGDATLKCQNIGELIVPSGKIVACDPLVFPENSPFTVQLPAGRYSVILSVAHFGAIDQRVAYAAMKIGDGKPEYWEMALLPDQDITTIKEDHIFCYPVDSGTGCFMDAAAAQSLSQKMDADDAYCETLIAELDKTYVDTWSWASLEIDPVTHANLIMFSSGLGDGCYASYFAFDEQRRPLLLVTDFCVFDIEEVAGLIH